MGLKLEHVSYLYGTDTELLVRALDDVNLEIPDGQFIGLIGHTGSGKSTLVQHLNGLLKPSEGTILFNGENIWAQDYSRKTLRSKVGLVFQYPEHQLFEIDVFSDVCFGPKNLGLDKKEVELRAYDALKKVGLPDELFYQSPFELSGGQKRRVAIAGVLAMKPEVLILDEPTAGLDPKGRDEILQQIQDRLQPDHVSVEDGLALIAVVGQGMIYAKGTAARIFRVIADANINIRMIDQGSSELNIIIAVKETDYELAIRSLYHAVERVL